MGRRGFGGRLAIGFVLAAALLVGPACKKKAAKPPEPGTGGAAARPDGGSGRGSPSRIVELRDGGLATVIEPSGDGSLLHPPADLAPVRPEFLCPGKEEFEPSARDPQADFSMEDLYALFPDLPHDKVQVDVKTEQGNIKCEVWPATAPRAAATFLGLATGARAWWHPCEHEWVRGKPFYDETSFYSVVPAQKLEAGCLYRGCESAAGFAAELAEGGAPLNKPGLLVMRRSGPAGVFGILDCAWKAPEPTKLMEGTCELDSGVASLASDWVAFGSCEHEGLMSAIYRLARVAPDRNLDPHAIHWLRAVGPQDEFYRYRPEQPAEGAEGAGTAPAAGPAGAAAAPAQGTGQGTGDGSS